jgi:ketosteroid isomerase-like protein
MPMLEPTVASAKTVILSHEQFCLAGDLDAVMANVAEDVVLLAAGTPLIQGAAQMRDFYAQLFAMGRWQFGHDFGGAEVIDNVVILHGVAEGTLTSASQEVTRFTNNFIHVLRMTGDGRLRLWRAAFAPATA